MGEQKKCQKAEEIVREQKMCERAEKSLKGQNKVWENKVKWKLAQQNRIRVSPAL